MIMVQEITEKMNRISKTALANNPAPNIVVHQELGPAGGTKGSIDYFNAGSVIFLLLNWLRTNWENL